MTTKRYYGASLFALCLLVFCWSVGSMIDLLTDGSINVHLHRLLLGGGFTMFGFLAFILNSYLKGEDL